ncbi:MAG: response regulator [Candidatus Omnitrophica bacterium]|nr:response regulator [Candidatus Omnitrophota bacterium]
MQKKILIVDNDIAVCVLVSAIVKKLGYESVSATDGYEAIKMLEKYNSISLVITDINMPMMNGLVLLEEIWRHFSHLKVIVMTSDITEELLPLKNRVLGIVDKFDLFHSLTGILDRPIKDLSASVDSTT